MVVKVSEDKHVSHKADRMLSPLVELTALIDVRNLKKNPKDYTMRPWSKYNNAQHDISYTWHQYLSPEWLSYG